MYWYCIFNLYFIIYIFLKYKILTCVVLLDQGRQLHHSTQSSDIYNIYYTACNNALNRNVQFKHPAAFVSSIQWKKSNTFKILTSSKIRTFSTVCLGLKITKRGRLRAHLLTYIYRRCYKNAPFKKRKRKKNKFRQIMSFGEHSLSQLAFSCLYHSSWEAKFVCFLIFVQLPSWSIILFLDFMGFVVETYSSQDGRRQVDVHYGRFSP